MRYAIISDIHSNLESLTIFYNLLPDLKVDKVICLGDIVGYNPNPNECIDILKSIENLILIRGNHDRAIAFNKYDNFSYDASIAVKWSIKKLNLDYIEFLKKIDPGPKLIDNLFYICHGSLYNEDHYILSLNDLINNFIFLQQSKIKILFYGHTHIKKTYYFNEKTNTIYEVKDNIINLNNDYYYLINPGSIGQPRDGDNRAAFLIFEQNKMVINFFRYEYNYKLTQSKIIAEKLPIFLADRLSIGK